MTAVLPRHGLLAALLGILLLVIGGLMIVALTPGRSPASSDRSDAPPRPASMELAVTVVQEGLSIPWDVAFSPDGRMFVSERPGRIRVYASGEPGAELLNSVDVENIRAVGEAGAMGMALDTDFENHPFLYLCASRDEDGEEGDLPWLNQLLRYRVTSEDVIFEEPVFSEPIRANRQHNGCAVEMDEAGHIWVTTGDGLSAKRGWPQQLDRLNGKVLRLNRDGSVPHDNPTFPNMDEPGLTYAIGHRNPQGLAFDPRSGDAYTAEHGSTVDDEVNRIVAGGNGGWPCYSGAGNEVLDIGGHEALDIDCDPPDDYLPPAWASGDPTLATSGLVFLSGGQWGDWEGSLIVACLKERDLRRFTLDESGELRMVETILNEEFGRLRAAAVGPDGALYVSTSNAKNRAGADMTPDPEQHNDVVIRIEPASGG